MKRYIPLIIIMSIALGACKRSFEDVAYAAQNQLHKAPIVVRDGCEYLQFLGAYNASSFSHKGDCKNPIHHNQGASN